MKDASTANTHSLRKLRNSARERRKFSHDLATSPDKSTEARLGDEMMGVCQHGLIQFGTAQRSSSLVHPVPRAIYARQLLADFGKTARVHSIWQRDPAYLDHLGHPKRIPIQGPSPSFRALCALAGLANEWRQLLALANQFGLSRLGHSNRLVYISDVMLLTGHPTLVLARAVVTIERYLTTCVHNAQPRRKTSNSLGDVTAEVSLSSLEFGRLAKDTRRFLGNFIESTDRQLLAAVARDASRRRSKRNTKWCGVTAFVFRD